MKQYVFFKTAVQRYINSVGQRWVRSVDGPIDTTPQLQQIINICFLCYILQLITALPEIEAVGQTEDSGPPPLDWQTNGPFGNG